ncbi:MAG TPA: hypothetical protein VFW04_00675 [Gemmatimonadaceae bacterium]|nr:hypothetical protein [Gemmatimonadaceae bacterium]
MRILGRAIDERFLTHRLKSSSSAGIVATLVAIGLFMYRDYADGVWSWDLLAVALTFVGIKMGLMAWYLFTD